MANLGEKLKNWSEVVWKDEDEKFMKVFEAEWEKATKELVAGTPEGQIRFVLFNRHTILRKLRRKLGKKRNYRLIEDCLNKKMKSEKFFYEFSFDKFPPHSAKSWSVGDPAHDIYGIKNVILFYANNIEIKPDCAKEVLQYWFETYVLENFEKDFKLEKASSLLEDNWYTWYEFYPILNALEHFKISLSEDKYKQIFTELCEKHGIKLKEFKRGIIEISL